MLLVHKTICFKDI